jgi:hypothetical protein
LMLRPAIARAVLLVAGITLFTWLGFAVFPGHTYLQSDTQIYLPILERLDAPGYLSRDLVAVRPHVSYTIYDEVAISLHQAFNWPFENILVTQQLIYRALGFLGVYLLVFAAGLSRLESFFVSALFHLGAALLGPAVLLVEYEPVPRAFASGLVFLSLGLFVQGKHLLAGLAGTLAVLYQPPTALPFWGVLLVGFLFDRRFRRDARPLFLPLLVGALLLANLAQLQPGVVETQKMFGHLSAQLSEIQHYRTKYVWVSLWAGHDLWSYLAIWICSVWAAARVWPHLTREWRWFATVMPIGGLLSVPLSYLLLEVGNFSVVPALQPARALVFTIAFGSLLCGIAACYAIREGRRLEAFGWLLPVFALPIRVRVLDLFQFKTQADVQQFGLCIALAALTSFALTAVRRNTPQFAVSAAAIAALAAFFIPLSGVINYPELQRKPVEHLAGWAESNTWGGSLFLFPDSGHGFDPGIFRARSRRALWVDWKSGGQVNYFESFAREWWARWQETMEGDYSTKRLQGMLDLPVDYFVLQRRNRLAQIKPVYQNEKYVVYDSRDLRNSSTSLRKGTDD